MALYTAERSNARAELPHPCIAAEDLNGFIGSRDLGRRTDQHRIANATTPVTVGAESPKEDAMFPYSLNDSDAQLQRQRDALDTAARARLIDQVRAAGHRSPAGEAMRAVLDLVYTFAYDSREGLHTKDQELAAYGVVWSTDLAYEDELGLELQAARQRRVAGVSAAPLAAPATWTATGGGLRWAIGGLLVRAGRRLQGGQRASATA
jgi:hypothetical protein